MSPFRRRSSPRWYHASPTILGVAHVLARRELLDVSHRLTPRAPELHDRDAVNEADPREGDELCLVLAPAREGGGPLARAIDRVDLLAARDALAIREAGDERRELVRRHGEHHLVENGEARVDAPLTKKGTALDLSRDRDEIAIARRFADCPCLARRSLRLGILTRRQVTVRRRHEKIASLGARLLLGFDEPRRAREPGCAGRAAERDEPKADPERRPCRPPRLVRLHACLVQALERAQEALVRSAKSGRPGQPLEVVPIERRIALRAREGVERIAPSTAIERRTAQMERALRRSHLVSATRIPRIDGARPRPRHPAGRSRDAASDVARIRPLPKPALAR